MKKIVALVHDLYEESELLYPVYRVREEGHAVDIAGERGDVLYRGKSGYTCKSMISYDEIAEADYDGVIIPGGFAPDKLRRFDAVLRCVRAMDDRGGVIAFICHGGWVPVSAGILRGKKVTGTDAIRDDLINAGAIWVDDRPVVIDGHLISSRTPADLPQFGKAIVRALC